MLEIVHESEDRTFGVARVKEESTGRTITAVGPLFGLRGGEKVRLDGDWTRHPQFGERFRASRVEVAIPTQPDGIRKYLASGLVPGIGKELAARIVRRFGAETLSIIDSEPERLREVEGIGKKRLASLLARIRAERASRDALVFLQSHGLTTAQAQRVREKYGNGLVEAVRAEPYRLADEVFGIGFKTADKLALSIGVPPDSAERAAAAVLHVLAEAAEKAGHVYLPHDELVALVRRLVPAEQEAIARAIEEKRREGALAVEGTGEERRVFPEFLRRAEIETAERLAALARASRGKTFPAIDAGEAIALAEKGKAPFSPGQREALRAALARKLCVVTGGPGVGKTTVLRGLLDILVGKGVRVALAAPTGRAAKRLAEATGSAGAMTIHRLLGFNPHKGRFVHGPGHEIAADVVIVDEASMIDILLARDLLRGLPLEASLVLVGDADQLPSVGPGRFLRDVIESGIAVVARLTQVFRQASRSRIVESAHRILAGSLPELAPPPAGTDPAETDFHFVEKSDPAEARRAVVEIAAARIPLRYGLDARRDVQVLSPMRRGECGTDALNRALEERLLPGAPGPLFRKGAKVMQTRNDYDREVWNGDIGTVVAASAEEVVVDFDGRSVRFTRKAAGDLVPAWAITIHKSQGSEYPAVVLPIVDEHRILLQRNLVYTAVTRARRLVVIVGSARALATAVRNASVLERRTSLAERLRRA